MPVTIAIFSDTCGSLATTALDFGDGPRPVRAVWVDGGGVTRYEAAVREKYPITSGSLPSFSRQHPRTRRECARVWNACVAQQVALATVAANVDSLSFCFSKGLGCPIGSVLVGRRELIERARRVRKMLGGGMRQAGIVAAAALYAPDHHVDRLAEDHAHARLLAEALDGVAGFRLRGGRAETNIVYFDVAGDGALAACDRLAAAGVRCIGAPSAIRMVTHLDVTRDDVLDAIDVCRRVLDAS